MNCHLRIMTTIKTSWLRSLKIWLNGFLSWSVIRCHDWTKILMTVMAKIMTDHDKITLNHILSWNVMNCHDFINIVMIVSWQVMTWLWRVMTQLWCIMTFHDRSWYIMKYHKMSRQIMLFHDHFLHGCLCWLVHSDCFTAVINLGVLKLPENFPPTCNLGVSFFQPNKNRFR